MTLSRPVSNLKTTEVAKRIMVVMKEKMEKVRILHTM
jgi:hypothetical protein